MRASAETQEILAAGVNCVVTKPVEHGQLVHIELAIDAGVALQRLESSSHEVEIVRTGATSATIG